MKTEKEKALATYYASGVVNKELTFGCEVRIYTKGEQFQGNESEPAELNLDEKFRIDTDEDHIEWDCFTFYLGDIEAGCTDKEPNEESFSFEIIGHPPQLQDWLRLIGDWDLEIQPWANVLVVTKEVRVCCCESDKETVLSFNLTDGQPATEADYKAINDIIAASEK